MRRLFVSEFATFATPPSALPMIKAGRLRALAATNRGHSPLMPAVPGVAEAGVAS